MAQMWTWLSEGTFWYSKKVCGITNALDGSENSLIRCAEELPGIQLPYIDENADDPFADDDFNDAGEDIEDNEVGNEDAWKLNFFQKITIIIF